MKREPKIKRVSEKQQAETLYAYIFNLQQAGLNKREIMLRLTTQDGLHPDVAKRAIDNLDKMKRQSRREAGSHNFITGAMICGFGILVTMFFYEISKANNSQVFIVASGAIFMGALQCLYGIFQSLS